VVHKRNDEQTGVWQE